MKFHAVSVCALALWAAAAVSAAEPPVLAEAAGRVAIRRAQALAEKGLCERAEATLAAVARSQPALADEAKKAADAVAAAKAKAAGEVKAAADYKTALKDSRNTGRPVLVLFGREACGNCRYTKAQLKDSRLIPYRRKIIQVMLDCDDAENRPLMSKLREGKNISTLPFLFYVSASEEVLEFTSGAQGADALKEKFDAVLAKHRPAQPGRLARATAAMTKANHLMDSGNCGAPIRTYVAVAKLDADVAIVQEAKDCLEIIKILATALLAEAQEAAAAKKYGEAVPIFVLLRRDFAGTKTATTAAEELTKLGADPEARDALAAAGVAATPPPEKTTATAKPPKPSAGDAEQAAKRLVNLARNFIANKRPDQARKYLDRAIAKYPDTDAAADARRMLRGLD